MTRTEIDLGELVERVHKLERQNFRWKIASIFLLLVLASLLATGLIAQERVEPPLLRAKAVEAQSFLLDDADGKLRGQMRMKAGGPSFEIYDQTGKVVWSIPSRINRVPSR
jgi:hypothetical protein